MSFSEIRIQDGVLNYRDEPPTAPKPSATSICRWRGRRSQRSFAATGQFDWRGERIDGSISISRFLAALSGERSGLKVRIAGPPLKLAFDGAVANETVW